VSPLSQQFHELLDLLVTGQPQESMSPAELAKRWHDPTKVSFLSNMVMVKRASPFNGRGNFRKFWPDGHTIRDLKSGLAIMQTL
jgi:hypothetical protein